MNKEKCLASIVLVMFLAGGIVLFLQKDDRDIPAQHVYIDRCNCIHSRKCEIVSNKKPKTEIEQRRTMVKMIPLDEIYKQDLEYLTYCGVCVDGNRIATIDSIIGVCKRWKSLYDHVSGDYELPDYDTFYDEMNRSGEDGYKNRKMLFDLIKDDYDVGETYEDFKKLMGI